MNKNSKNQNIFKCKSSSSNMKKGVKCCFSYSNVINSVNEGFYLLAPTKNRTWGLYFSGIRVTTTLLAHKS